MANEFSISSYLFLGEPVKFKIEIEPSKNYPVDFYILMDLTATMKDDLNNVKKLALDICKYTNFCHHHALLFLSCLYNCTSKVETPLRKTTYIWTHNLNV